MDEQKEFSKSGTDDNKQFNCCIRQQGAKKEPAPSRYSKYMSYPPRDNKATAIPSWELSQADLDLLEKEFVIVKSYSSEEMLLKIKELMYPILEKVLNGEEFYFGIPHRKVKEMDYHSDLCFPLLKRAEVAKRNFFYKNCTHSATMTIWALKIIFQNLNASLVMTIRDLFYRRSLLFSKQGASDNIINDICAMLGCTRRSLNLVSEERGSVCGRITIQLKNGRVLDCSRRCTIPDVREIKSCTIGADVESTIVLEKGTIFNYLEHLDFHNKHKCILLTSNGYPDVSARHFLKWLQKVTSLPVIGIADADPSGLEIMRCYAQGSANLGHENLNLAVPSLRWAGISLFDLEEEGLELTKFNSAKLSKKDKGILDNLLTDSYTKVTERWKRAVKKMRSVGRKASFEMIHEKGYHYAADCLLPRLISRALET